MGGKIGNGIPSDSVPGLEKKAKQRLRSFSRSRSWVFILYAEEDEISVNLLRRQAKIRWPDLHFDDFSLKEALSSGSDDVVKRQVRQRIIQVSVRLVYLTSSSADCSWVEWGLNECLKRGIEVIGIYEGDSPPSGLPKAFQEHPLRVLEWSNPSLTKAITEATQNL